MSAGSRLLRALSVAIRRESDHARGRADKLGDDGHSATRDRLRLAADVADILGDACNEAANDLDEQTMRDIEALSSKPGDVRYDPRGKR